MEVQSTCFGISAESVSTQENALPVRGGFICSVPGCFSQSKRNRELYFYQIPKEKAMRKIWLNKISRKDFIPNDGHRSCSKHFTGGRKTYMNNVPTNQMIIHHSFR